MHPFCCVSEISDRNPDSSPSSSNAMPPSHAPPPADAAALNGHDLSRGGNQRLTSEGIAKHSDREINVSSSNHQHLLAVDAREVKINDIVGNGICGVLYKWVNYGKGWRPRWFVLQDGVLSYYKIHGPDKIAICKESEKGSKVIGEESMRLITRQKRPNSRLRRKPFGEIHLKVSSIRESRSDEKRFSIFTGTKRLHLRAECQEDRTAWMEALQAVKDMFPRISNSELMAPHNDFQVSTEKLKQRLEEEGVSEAAIQDSEQIMRNEFSALQNRLMLLKQKQWQLIDTLRHLEIGEASLKCSEPEVQRFPLCWSNITT